MKHFIRTLTLLIAIAFGVSSFGAKESAEDALKRIVKDLKNEKWEKVYDSFSKSSLKELQKQFDEMKKMPPEMHNMMPKEMKEALKAKDAKNFFVTMMNATKDKVKDQLPTDDIIKKDVKDTEAVFTIRNTGGKEDTVYMVKEDGKWKIDPNGNRRKHKKLDNRVKPSANEKAKSSPSETFKAAVKAAEAKEWDKFYDFFSKDSIVQLDKSFEEMKKIPKEMLTMIPKGMQEAMKADTTKEYFTKLMAAVPEKDLTDFPTTEILEKEVKGDRTTLTVKLKNGKEETVDMVKEGDAWKVDFSKKFKSGGKK